MNRIEPSEVLIEQLQAQIAGLEQENEGLRRSTFRYQQVIENSPISVMFINTAGYITEMNQAGEQLFGLSIDELNAQACPICDNPQLMENGALPQMLKALAGEASIVDRADFYDATSATGKKPFGKGHYAPIRDQAGVIQEIVEIAPDFADLLAAQQALFQLTYSPL